MAFKVDENLLSPAAREFLNNTKCKAKAVRQALEFFVTYRANTGGGGFDPEIINNLNDKIDLILHSLKSRPTPANVPPVEKVDNVAREVVPQAEDKTESPKLTVEVQKIPLVNENKDNKPGIKLVNIRSESNEDEAELMKLALSSIENIIGKQE